eukprot:5784277-Prymnesium_polylepis.1
MLSCSRRRRKGSISGKFWPSSIRVMCFTCQGADVAPADGRRAQNLAPLGEYTGVSSRCEIHWHVPRVLSESLHCCIVGCPVGLALVTHGLIRVDTGAPQQRCKSV